MRNCQPCKLCAIPRNGIPFGNLRVNTGSPGPVPDLFMAFCTPTSRIDFDGVFIPSKISCVRGIGYAFAGGKRREGGKGGNLSDIFVEFKFYISQLRFDQ